MTRNKRKLAQFSESMRLLLTKEQEQIILERFRTEPDDGYEWSEQDITEQIRHILRKSPHSVTISDVLNKSAALGLREC